MEYKFPFLFCDSIDEPLQQHIKNLYILYIHINVVTNVCVHMHIRMLGHGERT